MTKFEGLDANKCENLHNAKFSENEELQNQLFNRLDQKIDRIAAEFQFEKMKQLEEIIDTKIKRLETLLDANHTNDDLFIYYALHNPYTILLIPSYLMYLHHFSMT